MVDQDGQEAVSATYVPENYIYDAARAIGSTALAAGLLVASYYLHRANAIYGRELLAKLTNNASSSFEKPSISTPAPPPNNNRNNKKSSVAQLQKQVESGKAPKEIDRVDPPHRNVPDSKASSFRA